MPLVTSEFEAELVRRRVKKWEFAAAHGIRADKLSVLLRDPTLPDSFLETLDRIAPVAREEAAAS